MAAENTEKRSVTGLDTASDRKEAEYNLVESLLSAAEFKTADENITEAEIKRGGRYLFSVHLHPIGDEDFRFARKKATVMMKNPNGKNLPPIEKEFNSVKFKSWVIYVATTEADQQKIWGNSQIMQKFGLGIPAESIDVLLTAGEKSKLFDLVTKISGMDEDEEGEEIVDQETFQPNAD